MSRVVLALIATVVAIIAAVALLNVHTTTPQRTVQSIFEDDQLLILQPPSPAGNEVVEQTLQTLRSLGVDRLRLLIEWDYLAPDITSTVAPAHFDATNPADYPAANWVPYDRIVRLAHLAGLAVDFDLSGPAPAWATAAGAPSGYATHYEPSAAKFGQFVQAVGRRYDGAYPGPAGPGSATPSTLPRVSFWSFWNEPNQPGWLAPQWSKTPTGTEVPQSPRIYRQIIDAAFTALQRTGHPPGRDTILIGELAPEGCLTGTRCQTPYPRAEWPIPPIPFVQALYCLGTDDRPLRGAAATSSGCPASASPATFVADNPGLFRASGFAHHPYSFLTAPSVSLPETQYVPLADLGRLETGLDRAFSAYGVNRQLPIYLTEYGYETSPPRPLRLHSATVKEQSLYLNEAQYMAWKDPRVKAMGQFELQDSAPDAEYPVGSDRYWESFQTGLEFLGGALKPSFKAYQLPIFVPQQSTPAGGTVLVWGMLRAAPNRTTQTAEIQWRPIGGQYRTISTAMTSDPSGFLERRITPPGTGALRIRWIAPTGGEMVSRGVGVAVAARP